MPLPGWRATSGAESRRLVNLLLLLLLCLPIFFFRLGSYGLVDFDEGFYQRVAAQMVESGDWTRLVYQGKTRWYDTFLNAPLHYWARALLITLFGDNYWTMRILSAVCGLLAVLVTWRLAALVAGDRAAFLAALFQATTWQFVYWHSARSGEMEAILTLLFTLSAFLFLRALERGGGFFGFHACLLAIMNLKLPLVLLPLLAGLAFLALVPRHRGRLREWVFTGAAVLPFGLAWHVWQAVSHFPACLSALKRMLVGAQGENEALSGTLPRNLLYYARILFFGAFPYAVLYPFALAGRLAAARREEQGERWYFLALQAALVLSFAVAVSKHFPWYIIPVYPFLSIFLAAWLCPSGEPRPVLTAGMAGALALSLLLWLSVGATTLNPFAYRSPALPVRLAWRTLPGVSALAGVLLTFGLLIGLTIVARRLWPEGWKRYARPSLAALLVAAASLRVICPLRYTDHVSEMERLADRLAADAAAGKPLPERIPIVNRDKWEYFLGDRYRLWRYGDKDRKQLWLIRRDQPYPPVMTESMGKGLGSGSDDELGGAPAAGGRPPE